MGGEQVAVPPHCRQCYGSWQVATVLNPSLRYSMPASELSIHTREKRERERENGVTDQPGGVSHPEGNTPQMGDQAGGEKAGRIKGSKVSYQLPLPPQQVSARVLSKAMPKYTRLYVRPGNRIYLAEPESPTDNSRSSESPSPVRSDHHGVPVQQQAIKAASGTASPTSIAAERGQTPSHGTAKCSREPSPEMENNTSIGLQSAVATPITVAVAPDVASPARAKMLRTKLAALAQNRGGAEGGAPGGWNGSTAPGVALPPTPPVGHRARRVRQPHPPEPTLETYERASPFTHATNSVWNERRDASRQKPNPRQSILITNS